MGQLKPNTHRRRDSTQLSSWVASAVCIEFATSWRQFRRVSTSLNNLPTTKSSCVVSAVWTHQSSVVTQFPIFCVNCRVESRRRRRCVLNSQLAHDDCRRLPTKIWKLNMLRIYPVELSRVELCRRCVRAPWLSWPSLQFCSQWETSRTQHVTHDAACL